MNYFSFQYAILFLKGVKNMKNPILQYMKKHKITEKELAKKCGFSVYILSTLIACQRTKTGYVFKLCRATKIQPNDYFKYYEHITKK